MSHFIYHTSKANFKILRSDCTKYAEKTCSSFELIFMAINLYNNHLSMNVYSTELQC